MYNFTRSLKIKAYKYTYIFSCGMNVPRPSYFAISILSPALADRIVDDDDDDTLRVDVVVVVKAFAMGMAAAVARKVRACFIMLIIFIFVWRRAAR